MLGPPPRGISTDLFKDFNHCTCSENDCCEKATFWSDTQREINNQSSPGVIFLGSGGAGPSSGGTSVRNWESELAKMREMGISDETLAKKALTLMGGDIQAAIELIFSGWDGMDDSTN